jgi:predicted small metal-binding protein
VGTYELKVKNETRDKVQRAKTTHMKKKHKITVIGDNHARGCAAEIKLNLDEGFEVQGFVNPGAGVNTITTSAKMDIKHPLK